MFQIHVLRFSFLTPRGIYFSFLFTFAGNLLDWVCVLRLSLSYFLCYLSCYSKKKNHFFWKFPRRKLIWRSKQGLINRIFTKVFFFSFYVRSQQCRHLMWSKNSYFANKNVIYSKETIFGSLKNRKLTLLDGLFQSDCLNNSANEKRLIRYCSLINAIACGL